MVFFCVGYGFPDAPYRDSMGLPYSWGATTRRAHFGSLMGPRERRNAFRGERTSKGAERVFAVRRKQSEADFARTKRSEESVISVLLRNRDTPSVTFGDSSLREGAKDESCGFDRLTASE